MHLFDVGDVLDRISFALSQPVEIDWLQVFSETILDLCIFDALAMISVLAAYLALQVSFAMLRLLDVATEGMLSK